MIPVSLLVHRVPGVDPSFVVPSAQLTRLFKEFGVALEFTTGVTLDHDPATWPGYVAVVNRWHPTPLLPGSAAHLFIGKRWDDDGAGATNGALLTPERSAIGVFTGSIALSGGSNAVFLQVIAHEICHLLHLTHEHGDPDVPTAECPDSVRGPRHADVAWLLRGRTCPVGVNAFPLSQRSEERLASVALREVLPWGEKFRAIGTAAAFHRRKHGRRMA